MYTFKTSKVITPQYEENELRQGMGSVSMEFPCQGLMLHLNCRLLRVGYALRGDEISYDHPPPPFTRLFLFFKKGGKVIANGEETEFIPGRIYLLPDGQPFNVLYYEGAEFLYIHVHVSDFSSRPVFQGVHGIPFIDKPALVDLYEPLKHNTGDLLFLNMTATTVFHFINLYIEKISKRAFLAREFDEVFNALRDTPLGSVRIDDIAQSMSMTSSALSKSFQRKMGISLKRFITDRILEKARELLLYTDLTIEKISDELGYSNPNYFHKVFRKLTGMTPTEYRQVTGLDKS